MPHACPNTRVSTHNTPPRARTTTLSEGSRNEYDFPHNQRCFRKNIRTGGLAPTQKRGDGSSAPPFLFRCFVKA